MSGIDPTASLQMIRPQASDAAGGMGDRLRQAAKDGDVEGVREAARKFEQYFVQTMLKEMRAASGGEDGLMSGSEMDTFSSLFDEEIAGRISEGPGIGLASMIEATLARSYGADAARGVVGADGPRAHHAPAPLSARAGWSWPLPDQQPGRISSDFGHRADPISGASRRHGGLDVAAPAGTAVLAMATGRVVRADYSDSYGNVVDIEHADGTVSRYAHQARLDVAVGDEVRAGEQIGTVGSTGRSTGPHLHVEIRTSTGAVDPQSWLRDD